eukprot:CAMPEP_0180093652 /NCGR_PEP_ID=MMETSP0985-20121206/25184_1 /TAXON_ID=483367 /ORGANISM="non described non described, Strain CCMP 2436" /LENGTH=158 /DNA_ID=CAMNT_0022028745 /DNA_START=59 /DNA_END=536 /DNA_ORIENTATION=+
MSYDAAAPAPPPAASNDIGSRTRRLRSTDSSLSLVLFASTSRAPRASCTWPPSGFFVFRPLWRRGILLDGGEDLRVALVRDGERRAAEHLAARGAERDVGAGVVVDGALGKHGVVLDLRLADGGAVVRDHDELGCARFWFGIRRGISKGVACAGRHWR